MDPPASPLDHTNVCERHHRKGQQKKHGPGTRLRTKFFQQCEVFFFQIGLWKLFSHDMKASFEGFESSRCCMT